MSRPPARGAAAGEPDPVHEVPPADAFCDLVLNGGVASGVVYPWALVELARRYRFRRIGGNSVGAMAAAMAAAAEYGRCNGVEEPFEPLRRFPQELARERDGLPQMLRLFQPAVALRRLFAVFLLVVGFVEGRAHMAPAARPPERPLLALTRLYAGFEPILAVSAVALAAFSLRAGLAPSTLTVAGVLGFAATLVAALALTALVTVVRGVRADLEALEANDYGLCRGSRTGDDEALVEWLHRGIQCSAGRGELEPPLCFADLWAAPRSGRAGPGPAPGGLQPEGANIDLQMFASNVTLGRPIRLPLNDANTRLFYHPDEWRRIFPERVMKALDAASIAYAPASGSDPQADRTVLVGPGPRRTQRPVPATALRELPSGGMPVVVAARLSLCFPLLFSCVPVYAIDYELGEDQRTLRRCLLSDGGLCSNFPVHLFDAACPRWPTFAFLLDKRLQAHRGEAVWLPRTHLEGRADNWQRGVPGAELPAPTEGGEQRERRRDPTSPHRRRPPSSSAATRLLGLLGGMFLTSKDWNDRVTGRLPTVRNRIVRIALEPGEGSLNIAMPGAAMLRMADEYGVAAARELIAQFTSDPNGPVKPGWRDQLYVRTVVEVRALRAHLRGYAAATTARAHTLPLDALLAEATASPAPAAGAALQPDERDALLRAVRAVEALQAELDACESLFGPYLPVLAPELRLRPPI